MRQPSARDAQSWARNPSALKPRVNVGTIGRINHGKTTLTAAIAKVLSKHNPKNTFRSFDTIDNAPESVSAASRYATSHVEYKTKEPALRARRLPGSSPITSRT